MNQEELIEHIRSTTKPEDELACLIWSHKDILQMIDDNNETYDEKIIISADEAKEIMREINRKADCGLGITWTTLEVYIDNFISERDAKTSQQKGGDAGAKIKQILQN
jgi:hypothetical protein